MSRRYVVQRCFASLTPLLRPETPLNALSTTCPAVQRERVVEGLKRRTPPVQGISSSPIIFRFLDKWEDVEGTIQRLERRQLLTSRHLIAAFKILQTLPTRPSTAFLSRLVDHTRVNAERFSHSDISTLFRALAVLRFYDAPTLEALIDQLLKRRLLPEMTRNELVQTARSVRWMQERGELEVLPQFQEALSTELLRASRLKKFTDGQLLTLLNAVSGWKAVSFEALERLLHETAAPNRHLTFEDRLKLLRLSALHTQREAFRMRNDADVDGVESPTVDAFVSNLLNAASLKRYSTWELQELFDGIRVHRAGDRASLEALVSEISRPERLANLSATQKWLMARGAPAHPAQSPLTAFVDLIRTGYADEALLGALWSPGEQPERAAGTHR